MSIANTDSPRVLIYSHDSFGLGHLRRCRTIAHALVERYPGLSVLILTGSPIIGSFDFKARVDFVRVPGVIKLRNGEYTNLSLHIDPDQTLAMRASIIQHTAESFNPDIFIVDKEPLGLRGEVQDTLVELKKRGTRLVLGLRDVMDDPVALVPEWERKKVQPALEELFDDIWVYGLPQIHNPLDGIDLPDTIMNKITYTGYLPRDLPDVPATIPPEVGDKPYILVTTGGGGDGEDAVDWVLRAYEKDPHLPYQALVVFGPFMNPERQADFLERVSKLSRVHAITFDAHIETVLANAIGVVAMGGYNTFCEILSFNKKALIIPRKVPRLEQFIRATKASELGLMAMIDPDELADTDAMIKALRALPHQASPKDVVIPGLLEGLDNVARLVEPWVKPDKPERPGNIVPLSRQT